MTISLTFALFAQVGPLCTDGNRRQKPSWVLIFRTDWRSIDRSAHLVAATLSNPSLKNRKKVGYVCTVSSVYDISNNDGVLDLGRHPTKPASVVHSGVSSNDRT